MGGGTAALLTMMLRSGVGGTTGGASSSTAAAPGTHGDSPADCAHAASTHPAQPSDSLMDAAGTGPGTSTGTTPREPPPPPPPPAYSPHTTHTAPPPPARDDPLRTARCVAIACPATVTPELAAACGGFVTSVMNGTDIVPTFCAATVDDLREDVTRSSWFSEFSRDMRSGVVRALQGGVRGVGTATQWTSRNILQPAVVPFRACYTTTTTRRTRRRTVSNVPQQLQQQLPAPPASPLQAAEQHEQLLLAAGAGGGAAAAAAAAAAVAALEAGGGPLSPASSAAALTALTGSGLQSGSLPALDPPSGGLGPLPGQAPEEMSMSGRAGAGASGLDPRAVAGAVQVRGRGRCWAVGSNAFRAMCCVRVRCRRGRVSCDVLAYHCVLPSAVSDVCARVRMRPAELHVCDEQCRHGAAAAPTPTSPSRPPEIGRVSGHGAGGARRAGLGGVMLPPGLVVTPLPGVLFQTSRTSRTPANTQPRRRPADPALAEALGMLESLPPDLGPPAPRGPGAEGSAGPASTSGRVGLSASLGQSEPELLMGSRSSLLSGSSNSGVSGGAGGGGGGGVSSATSYGSSLRRRLWFWGQGQGADGSAHGGPLDGGPGDGGGSGTSGGLGAPGAGAGSAGGLPTSMAASVGAGGSTGSGAAAAGSGDAGGPSGGAGGFMSPPGRVVPDSPGKAKAAAAGAGGAGGGGGGSAAAGASRSLGEWLWRGSGSGWLFNTCTAPRRPTAMAAAGAGGGGASGRLASGLMGGLGMCGTGVGVSGWGAAGGQAAAAGSAALVAGGQQRPLRMDVGGERARLVGGREDLGLVDSYGGGSTTAGTCH